MIEARFFVSVKELMRGVMAQMRYKFTYIYFLPLIGLLYAMFDLILRSQRHISSSPGLTIAIVVFSLIYPLLILMIVRWQLSKIPILNKEAVYSFSLEKLIVKISESESKISWSDLYAAIIVAGGILIYQNKVVFNWIPASAFTNMEDFAAAAEIVKQKMKRVKDKR